ncbi:inter-alpha-trypsin inhibitor heavy chain H2-like [Sinocyclocheilus rhinocerous]|uniref:inter-alpha-trypsin inhibitor heavy chain H2-like n=1 Tax=Sinocyclocheilus rhinocerous TaxID=307959 RepID=UPI0007B9E55D|nr:PREDICTED: inter-alpha-trypsin inhibitor heavy chain H2-like [Sinocyclocheilus rhinocerous]
MCVDCAGNFCGLLKGLFSGSMKTPVLLCVLLFSQSWAFEFIIDGEWESETSGPLDQYHHSGRYRRNVLTSEEEEDFEVIQGNDITVKSYKVESRITSRFTHTTVKSSVVNSGPNAQSIGFNVEIPKRAFINNFTMNVNGITFTGSVKEKSVARNLYAQARARGKAAGIVRTNSQAMETFRTEVHVPPGSKVEFELHYQGMMQRKLGVYQHTLHLQPGRLVPLLQVDVYIFEPKGIKFVTASNTLGEQFSDLTKITHTKEKAHLVFKPTLQQQRKCENCTESAVDGVFTVTYDVERESNAGELQVSDGHFVQFFAPSDLSPLSKNIVFVIDVSGSMWGLKMKQTVEAMKAILDDLSMDDYFSIIDFNHNVRCWNEDMVQASSIQVNEAKKYIQSIKPNGGTNINEALLRAVQMLLRASNHGLIDPRSVSMIILVSDGDPTVGEIKLSTIQKNVKRVMREEFSLYSLGIGFDVDFDFLERIAMDNRGIAQRIYANHDAADQLKAEVGYMNISFLRFPLIVLIYFASVDFLSCSSLAPTANKKRRITQRIMALAVEHQFVTPFTAMLVEGHDQGGAERLIADSPRDSKHGCCSTTAPLSGPRPVQQLLYAKPQWIQPTYAPNQEAIGTLESTIITSVDNDPHFIIHLPKSNMDICFNIDSKPGHILNLISDPGTGVTINGQLVGSKKMKNNKIDTYFGTISIYSKTHSVQVIVGTNRIDLMEGRNNHSFSWGATAELVLDRMRVTIVKEEHVTVTVDGKISVMVLLHRVWKKHPVQVDFLGVYMSSDNKYSTRVHGLIGQFAQEPEVKVYGVHEGADPKKKEATMEVKGNKVAVTRGWQKDYRRNKKRGSDVYCWFIHNSGKGFIDGSYTSYILPQLDSFLTAI